VPEICDLVDGAGLRLATFIEPLRYEPETYIADPVLRRRFAALGARERAAVAEDLCGSLKSHVFYAVRQDNPAETVARPDGPEVIPVLRDVDGPALAAQMRPGGTLTVDLGGIKAAFPLPALAPAIVARIDGRRSLADIHGDLSSAPAWDAFLDQFGALYRVMNGLNRLLLRLPADSR
jgi:hypothetical protein